MNDYFPGPMERFGRRIKLEYLGMASVYAIIALLFLSDSLARHQTLFATLGAFFLFLGLKKKTEDHLMGSLVLFAASGLAFNLKGCPEWLTPYMLLGMTVFVMEGYLERRPLRIYALPAVLVMWSLVDPSWWLAWVFVAIHLTAARAERPELRRRLACIAGLCLLLGVLARAIFLKSAAFELWPFRQGPLPLDTVQVELLFVIGIPTLLCLALYWQKLAWPHRLNTLLFAFLAPWDGRTAAMFGMQAAILLTATVFRDSVNTSAWRPFFKHFEWHYFWYVLALAIGLFVNRVLPA